MAEVASEGPDCTVSDVALAGVLRAEDAVMTQAMELVAGAAHAQGLGGVVCVDSVARGLIVHLPRRYAEVPVPCAHDEGA